MIFTILEGKYKKNTSVQWILRKMCFFEGLNYCAAASLGAAFVGNFSLMRAARPDNSRR